ncbi:drug/metabolite transporter (DMT)-like permease [Actinopolyspora lacussalsi]|nr:drug/metabolite transporter (DMT)-like permease [Actinopolyspora lacussalsi]
MNARRLRGLGLAFAVASALFFGGSGPFAKPLLVAGLGSLQVTWLRLAGAALLMSPLLFRYRSAVRSAPVAVVGYGLFAVAGVQACYFGAIATIPVGVALLIEFLGPVLVLVWARFVLRRPVTPMAVIGVVLAVTGLAFVVRVWAGVALHPVGLLLGLGAAACQAAYFLLSESTASVRPSALAACGLLVGAVVMTVPARPWRMDWSVLASRVELAGHELPAAFAVVWIVLVSTVFAYLTGIVAVRGLSAPIAGGVAYLEPVVATVLAWWLLHETLLPVQLFGGVLVLLGAFLAQWGAPRRPVDSAGATTEEPLSGGRR